jgi:hypothetical protein
MSYEEYMGICQSKDDQKVDKKIGDLGTQSLRLSNEVHQKHVRMLKIIEKVFVSLLKLNDLKCDGVDDAEIQKVAEAVKSACEEDMNAFLFLSFYLMKCIKNYEKNGQKSVQQVSDRLTEILKMLRK